MIVDRYTSLPKIERESAINDYGRTQRSINSHAGKAKGRVGTGRSHDELFFQKYPHICTRHKQAGRPAKSATVDRRKETKGKKTEFAEFFPRSAAVSGVDAQLRGGGDRKRRQADL